RFPDTGAALGLCAGGVNDNRLCSGDDECGGGTCTRTTGQSDAVTFTGPALIAVTPLGQPLACGASCTGQSGLGACVDKFFADGAWAASPRDTFTHFTALPKPNNYQGLCTDPVPPCLGTQDDIRFTVDTDGNVLVPFDWRGVLVQRDKVPVARLLRATSTVEAFEGR